MDMEEVVLKLNEMTDLDFVNADIKRDSRTYASRKTGVAIMVVPSKNYSAVTEKGHYFIGINKEKFDFCIEKFSSEKFFVTVGCASIDQILIIPSTYLRQTLDNVKIAKNGDWKIHFYKNQSIFEIAPSGKKEDISEYLNRWELLTANNNGNMTDTIEQEIQPIDTVISNTRHIEIIKDDDDTQIHPTQIIKDDVELSINDKIMRIDGVRGNTLHDRVVDIIRQTGEWAKYRSEANHTIHPELGYELDVAWIDDDIIDIAIEVQIGGNITEAKDRLIQAMRCGARKCIIISNSDSIGRIKTIFRLETDIKRRTEIWSLEKVYDMFVNGRNFFKNFNNFNRHQYHDDIIEIR